MKEYMKPVLIEEIIETEDICTTSSGNKLTSVMPGDLEIDDFYGE